MKKVAEERLEAANDDLETHRANLLRKRRSSFSASPSECVRWSTGVYEKMKKYREETARKNE